MEEILDTQPVSGTVEYASFGTRFVAALIDGIILNIVNYVIGLILGDSIFLRSGVGAAIGIAYYAYLESSDKQATIGKQLMNIKVIGEDGGRISMQTALIRNLSKILSALILLIGYIMAAFDAKKQALHDKIAATYVVKK